jgi:hypothetical protein
MKKSCTVTHHYQLNYGAFLQTWALQQFLGKSNLILNFAPICRPYSFVGERARRILPFFWRLLALWRFLKHHYLRRRSFNEINMLNLTCKYFSIRAIVKNPPQADAYIAGSDQIWNPEAGVLRKAIYFLAFGSPNTKRIAYAASMGMREWPLEFTQQVLPYLKKFDAISVREESSVPFLNSIGLENVTATCDPTILWTADFYRSHFSYTQNQCLGKVFVYHLGKQYSASVRQFIGEDKIVESKLGGSKLISVTQWLHSIDTCNFVITSSFHGTVFSIIFHKPFISLSHIDGDERLINLLRKVKLEYRLSNGIKTKEEIEEILYRPVDWEQVDEILEEWRTYSSNWLRSAIDA